MRGDIVLSGFVLTADEWDGMDTMARAQLLRAGGRWLPSIPPLPLPLSLAPAPRRRDVDDPYEHYELVGPPP